VFVNGLNWVNESIILPSIENAKYEIRESPVVWIEDNIWKIVFTQISAQEDTIKEGLVYAESLDGKKWNIDIQKMNWEFFYDQHMEEVEIEKVLLDGVIIDKQGYLFTGKYFTKQKWLTQYCFTGSFYITCLESRGTHMKTYNYGDSPDMKIKIDSINAFINPVTNKTVFTFIDNSNRNEKGVTNGVYLGYIHDKPTT